MVEPKVWTFFYGSYINFDVLREVDLVPEAWDVARLAGFELRIAPRANLVRSDRDIVYGIVATATHAELDRLYAHARLSSPDPPSDTARAGPPASVLAIDP